MRTSGREALTRTRGVKGSSRAAGTASSQMRLAWLTHSGRSGLPSAAARPPMSAPACACDAARHMIAHHS